MWSLGVVTGWWIFYLPHNEVSLLLLCLSFFAPSSLFYVSIFVNCFSFLFLLLFFSFSTLLRERIISMEQAGYFHL